jgi:hypothetical protein
MSGVLVDEEIKRWTAQRKSALNFLLLDMNTPYGHSRPSRKCLC